MNRTTAFGLTLTTLGVVGYGLGIAVAYPGRSFAVTAVMVGIAVLAVGYGDGGVAA
jgi:alanine racemase